MTGLRSLDFAIEQLINGPAGHTAGLDQVMVAAASWSEPAFIGVIVAWFLYGMVRNHHRDRLGAVTALFAAGAALLINFVLSHVYFHPRPFVAHPGLVHLLVNHARDNSFPSDHAAGAFAVAAVLVAVRRRIGIVALLGAALVGYARVYVGDHYPLDVVVGVADGLLGAILFLTVLKIIPRTVTEIAELVLVRLHLQPRPSRAAEAGQAPRNQPGASGP